MSTTAPSTLDLGLEGMTCAACASRIEKVLNRVPGVTASVNFATEKAHVALAADISVDALIGAVRKAGYDAHPLAQTDTATEKARRAVQYRDELRRFGLAVAFSLPLIAQMPFMLAGEHAEWLPRWLQLALATPVQFWIARRFYSGAWHALRGGGANMDVLIALGTSMAYVYSAVVTLWQLAATRLLRSERRHHHAGADGQAAGSARAAAMRRPRSKLCSSCSRKPRSSNARGN